jgi:hypothetical protein
MFAAAGKFFISCRDTEDATIIEMRIPGICSPPLYRSGAAEFWRE